MMVTFTAFLGAGFAGHFSCAPSSYFAFFLHLLGEAAHENAKAFHDKCETTQPSPLREG
ncbi:hypothetical protein KCP76_16270 [Salmonella enterica subsp. enterica serovar Weltevreden]|nr:hypothetical protein KCP76_16270 [Salmonella enterica subsp. enterica serovar Weltevreden]